MVVIIINVFELWSEWGYLCYLLGVVCGFFKVNNLI